MQKKFKEKYNDGCIKIFTLYKLLYEDRAYYDDVMKIFTEDENDKEHVILNKYLNTLKVFGIKVKKENKKFVLLNNSFGLNFDINDVKSVNMFEQFAHILPNGKTKNNLEAFLNMIRSRFDDKTNELYTTINSTNNSDYSFYYSDLRGQIEKCERFCQENFNVDIKYLYKGKVCYAYAKAKQMIYDNKNAYLQIYKIKDQQLENILVPNILYLEQSNNVENSMEFLPTITYKITGRLAKAYNLKESEYVREVLDDGSKVIVNTSEPTDQILQRLIRYNTECVILSPKNLKSKMIDMINDTLKNYE